jgi:hypothetical protein
MIATTIMSSTSVNPAGRPNLAARARARPSAPMSARMSARIGGPGVDLKRYRRSNVATTSTWKV